MPGVAGAPFPLLPTLPIVSGPLIQTLPGLLPSVLSVAPSLTRSVVTLDQGALKHLVTIDLGRDFDKTALHLDWTNAKDAVLDSSTNVYGASIKQSFGSHFAASLTGGVSQSTYGSATFGGLSAEFNF